MKTDYNQYRTVTFHIRTNNFVYMHETVLVVRLGIHGILSFVDFISLNCTHCPVGLLINHISCVYYLGAISGCALIVLWTLGVM